MAKPYIDALLVKDILARVSADCQRILPKSRLADGTIVGLDCSDVSNRQSAASHLKHAAQPQIRFVQLTALQSPFDVIVDGPVNFQF